RTDRRITGISYTNVFVRGSLICFTSVLLEASCASKTTFPLLRIVLTFLNPIDSSSFLRSSILTCLWLARLMPRRRATYRTHLSPLLFFAVASFTCLFGWWFIFVPWKSNAELFKKDWRRGQDSNLQGLSAGGFQDRFLTIRIPLRPVRKYRRRPPSIQDSGRQRRQLSSPAIVIVFAGSENRVEADQARSHPGRVPSVLR